MSIILINPNNIAIKVNFTTPVYAHYDRHKYFKTIINPSNNQEEQVEYHKCVLHINTFLSETNFDSIIYSVQKNGTIIANDKSESDENLIVLQDDTEDRIDVENDIDTIDVTYITESNTKTKKLTNINKTLVCSNRLKLHEGMYPFNYDNIFNEGGNNNE